MLLCIYCFNFSHNVPKHNVQCGVFSRILSFPCRKLVTILEVSAGFSQDTLLSPKADVLLTCTLHLANVSASYSSITILCVSVLLSL